MTAHSSQPRWRRLDADERREQILTCAVRLFGQRPYVAVSTSDLAGEAGVTRSLLNHYFGTKRDLYVEVVRRMVQLPQLDAAVAATGPLTERVELSVAWFLDTISEHGSTFVAITGAEGVANDPDIARIIADADDLAARRVLETLDVDAGDPAQQATIRAYSGLVKAAVREWIRDETLTRAQVQLLLSQALLAIVRDVLPVLDRSRPQRSSDS